MASHYNQNRILDVVPPVGTTIFSAGDVVGGLLTVPIGQASGTIRQINLVDDDNEKAALTIYIFSAAPSSMADNAPFAPTVADLKLLIAPVAVSAGDYVTVNSNAYALKPNLNIDYATDNGNLYLYLVCTGTPTYTAATDLYLRLFIWDDRSG